MGKHSKPEPVNPSSSPPAAHDPEAWLWADDPKKKGK